MDLHKLENALCRIFGQKNVKPYTKGFRIIVDYENMPYCVVLKLESNKLAMEKDAIDCEEAGYEEAYKKAYKMMLQAKDMFEDDIEF